MKLIVTINNAQMRTIHEDKFGYTNNNRKENLEKSEIKNREKNTLCRHGENPTDQQSLNKSQTLNKEKFFQDSDQGRASDF